MGDAHNRDRNSGEGSFCMAFQTASDAMEWCMEAQQELVKVEWPSALLDHPGAAEEWSDIDDRVLFKGLRVRMGVHVGQPRTVRDPMTRRIEFIGPVVNAAARITALTHGGQIVLSEAAFTKLKGSDLDKEGSKRLVCLGKFEMPDAPRGVRLFELKPRGLEGRFFGGITLYPNKDDSDQSSSASGNATAKSDDAHEEEAEDEQRGPVSARARVNEELQAVVGEGYALLAVVAGKRSARS
jgi:hypothetical protein